VSWDAAQETRQDRRTARRPGRTAAGRRGPRDGRVGDDDAVDLGLEGGASDIVELVGRQVGGDLDHDGRLDGATEAIPGLDDRVEEFLEHAPSLEGAQAGRIGRGDVDDEDVGVGSELLDALDVVVDRVRVARLVLAEVDGEDAAGAQAARHAGGIDGAGVTAEGRA
jgi:hypothetical protein